MKMQMGEDWDQIGPVKTPVHVYVTAIIALTSIGLQVPKFELSPNQGFWALLLVLTAIMVTLLLFTLLIRGRVGTGEKNQESSPGLRGQGSGVVDVAPTRKSEEG